MKLLIVDDHAPFRDITRIRLSREGYDVVGEADGIESARGAVADLRPDVVLLDIQLPDGDGIDLAGDLDRSPHGPRVVLTSTRPAADYGRRLSDAPVAGFVPKQDVTGAALRSVLQVS